MADKADLAALRGGAAAAKAPRMLHALMMTAALTLGAAEPPANHSLPAVDDHPRNRLTLGPTPLLLGWIAVEYERAISDRFSLVFGPQFRPRGLLFGLEGRGGRVVLGSRFFLFGRAPTGGWLGAEIIPTYEEMRADEGSTYATTRSIVGLLTAGQTISVGPLTGSAGIGLGAGYLDGESPESSRTIGPFTLPNYRGFIPAVSLHLNGGVIF
jgi:hypothetical protein